MKIDRPVCSPVYIVDDNAVSGMEMGRRLSGAGISNQIFVPVKHFLDAAHLLPVGSIVLDEPFFSGAAAEVRQALQATGMPIICLSPTVSPLPQLGLEAAGDYQNDSMAAFGARERINMLSGREREVLSLLLAGKSIKAIAAGLGLSPRTVETHRSRLLKHLKVATTAHAIRIAVEAGL